MHTIRPTHAIVRPPGASFAQAICSQPAQIDVALAQTQHAEYRAALTAAGLAVEVLPADERYPDSCFVQDTAVIARGLAVITRPGAASRRGEEDAVAARLSEQMPIARIVAPGTLEGGDVLALPGRLVVGRSGRTNRAGIAQLAVALSQPAASEAVSPDALSVEELPIAEGLHLLSGVVALGRNTLLAVAAYAGLPTFAGLDIIIAPPAEAYAVNVLAVGDYAIVPAGYPTVAAALHSRGFTVLPVPTSEFAKADGGVTCLSVVW